MIRQDVIDSLPSLRRALAATTTLHDSRRLQSRYLMRVVEVRSQVGLQQLLDREPDEQEIIRWFHGELYRVAKDELDFAWSDMWGELSPAQRFQTVGVSFDPFGFAKPPAGPMPKDITDSSMSLRDILWRISPLLVLNGDQALDHRLGSPLFNPDPTWVPVLVEAGRNDVTWRRSIAITLAMATANLRLADFLLGILRHEALRIFNDVDATLLNAVPSYVGYTLRSQNLPTTDPEHAAKDGWKFFRDDREGSSLPWAERIIPPYRRNCACYMVPILEEPTDPEFKAQYRLPIGKGQSILIRDPLYFSEWFDRQPAFVQKKLMGEQRWWAAASKGIGHINFADFLAKDGSVISPRRLMNESVRERHRRRIYAQLIMTTHSFLLREGWRKLTTHHSSLTTHLAPIDPAIEAEYRDKLVKRIGALLKNS